MGWMLQEGFFADGFSSQESVFFNFLESFLQFQHPFLADFPLHRLVIFI